MTYLELDSDGLAFQLLGVEVMSINAGCLELNEFENDRTGGAFMVRFDWSWLGGMVWIGSNGPEINLYRRGGLAKTIDTAGLEPCNAWLWDEPSDAELAEIEAELAVADLFEP